MKTVVAYHSLSGNAAWAAALVAEKLGAEPLSVEPVRAYPTRGAAKLLQGGKIAAFCESVK